MRGHRPPPTSVGRGSVLARGARVAALQPARDAVENARETLELVAGNDAALVDSGGGHHVLLPLVGTNAEVAYPCVVA